MRITLDWLTVKLNSDFTLDNWREWASTRVVSRETGEQTGILCPDRYWKFNRYGGYDYISAYGLGTNALASAAALYDLSISRLDVAVDFPTNQPEKALEELESKLDVYYASKGITVSKGQFDGRKRGGKGSRTLLYGKRASIYQIRAYTYSREGRMGTGGYCRCEFQLRGKLAKAFWQEASHDAQDPLTLRNATAQLERTIFGHPILEIGDLEQDTKLELPVQEKMHDRERWIRLDVLKAVIRHFDETGVNLAQLLVEDFNKHITSRGIVPTNDPFSSNDAEDQSKTKSLNPMHYTGSKRAKVAQDKYFPD